jgi:tetratricopeptide (TPR) repeat protein
MSGTSGKNDTVAPSVPPASPVGVRLEGADSGSLGAESPAAGLDDRRLITGVCIFLAAIIWVVFGQTLHHEFISLDDQVYVYDNPVVTRGLNPKGVGWAFTHIVGCNWHPLTMISHMLDCQLYGLNAGGHHLTNILLHTATTILLFLVLRRMTGFLWRSAFVAAVFAIHPLRVESVAWVAERKDVLSGLFFMLTLWAYTRYVTSGKWRVTRTNPASSRFTFHVSLFYCLVVFLFALGLMCKPMLVTMPLVLLLLDYWPLGRVTSEKTGRPSTLNSQLSTLLLEKLPLLGLAVASCVVTIFAQAQAIMPIERMSLFLRVGNALISCVTYLGQIFWPSGLAVLYPFAAGSVGVLEAVLSLVLLAGISTGAFFLRQRRPYFLTGWLWYLIMLAPVIGILQVGSQARADRYTYLPQIGLYLLLTWAAADLLACRRHRRVMLGGCAAAILAALIFCARTQTSYWRNNESLWTHTLACTSDNAVAHNSLGNALLQKGSLDEAMEHFQTALQINPGYMGAHNNLGNALLQKGSLDEAMGHFQMVLQIDPDNTDAHNNLGIALLRKGSVDEAIAQYQTALQIKPDSADAHNNLGNALLKKGSVDDAIAQYQTALQIKPDNADAHDNLGSALLQKGKVDEAIAQYQMALQIKPDYVLACYNLGIALLQKGRVDEAVAHFQEALQIKPDYAEAHVTLGGALRQKGRLDEAMAHFQKALEINPDSVEAHDNLGTVLLQKGKVDEAMVHFQKALDINPGYVEACNNLGVALRQKGRMDEAMVYFQKALEINSGYAEAHINLGNALLRKGKVDEAVVHYQEALQIKPESVEAHINLGNALLQKGRADEAVLHYQRALQIKPDFLEVLNNLAWLLATSPDGHIRDGAQAVKYAGRACELTHYDVPPLVGTLAAAYAEAGRYDEAIATGQKACALAAAAGERDLLEKNQKLLALYRARQPYHEAVGKAASAAP